MTIFRKKEGGKTDYFLVGAFFYHLLLGIGLVSLFWALSSVIIDLIPKKTNPIEFIQHAQAFEFTPGEESPKIFATVTAYTSRVEETNSMPFLMASGETVYNGAAACPSYLNFGSLIEIDGVVYTCEDRMALRYRHGDFFDIWFESYSEAVRFGRQTKEVKILLNK